MPSAPFHRPVRFDPHKFQYYPGAQGAQDLALAAQASARALLARGRANEDPSVTKRLVHFTDEFGLQTLTDLWAQAPAVSTAGALWRIYALRAVIRKDPPANQPLLSAGPGQQLRRPGFGWSSRPTQRPRNLRHR